MSLKAGTSIATALDLGVLTTNIQILDDAISAASTAGYYKFTIAENSKLNIKLSGLSQNADLLLLNADGSQVTGQSTAGGNVDENIIQNLRAGSYFFYVRGGGAVTNYKLETSAISLGAIPVDIAGSSLDRANDLGTLGATATIVNEFIGNFNGLETDFADYHQFNIAENSTVNLKLTGLSKNAVLILRDSLGNLITGSDNSPADKNITQNLRAGNYHIFVSNDGGEGTSYRFEANAVSLGAVPVDNAGESPYKAKNLGVLGTTETVANDFLGSFNGLSTDGSDYYQFTIAENSSVNLKLSGLSEDVNLQLYDTQQNLIQTANIGGNADENITRNLRAGTYYVYASGGGKGTNYQLTASANSFGAVPTDNAGDSLDNAKNIGVLGSTDTIIDEYVGDFGNLGGSFDFRDYYQFTITDNSTVNLNLSGLSKDTNISLLDSQGNSIKTSVNTGTSDENISQKLRSGTYFVFVSPASGLNGSSYRFSANAVGLGGTPVDTSPLNQASDLGTLPAVTLPTLAGEIAATENERYYKFTLAENSTINLKLSELNQDVNVTLLSSHGSTIASAAKSGNVDENIAQNLRAGVYYLRAYRGFGGGLFATPTNLTFKLDASVTSLGAVPSDNPGSSIDQSQDLGILKAEVVSATDFLGNFNNLSNDFTDYYKFTLVDNSTVNLKLSGLSQDANLVLLNSNGSTILSSSNTASSDENISRNLPKGTYYVRVDGGIGLFGGLGLPGGASEAKNTTYKLDASAIALGAIPADNAGENIDQAKDLGTIKTDVVSATDFLGNFKDLANDFSDYYKFTIADNSTVNLKLSGLSEDANLSLLNNRGTNILTSINTGSSDENISRNLQKGTYFVRVDGGIGLFGFPGAPGSPSNAKITNYKLDVSAVSIGAPPADNAGESINKARDLGVISEPQQITDYIGNFNGLSNDSSDYYKFRVTTDSFLGVNFTDTAINPNLQLFNSAGKVISTPLSFTNIANTSISQGITAGTYFLSVTPNGNVGTNYKLNIAVPTIADLAGNNNQTARDVGVLNGARSFTDFIGSIDSSDVYRFELKEKSTFNLNFNPDKSSDRTYINLTNSKGQFLGNNSVDKNIISQELAPGVYYAGIYNFSGSNSDTNYNLNLSAIAKQNSVFQILNVNPIAGSNQGEATIDIKGTKFTAGAKVSIVDPAGKEVSSSAVTVLNDTNIAAKFDLKGQVIGAYDVKVVDQASEALANDVFLVNNLAPGRLQVDIAAPGAVRPGAKGELVITYRNAGNTDIAAPLLTLVAKGALLEESGEYKDGTIQFLGINKEGNAGVLPAGATGSVRVKFRAGLDVTNIDFQVNSLALDENVDWNSIKESSRPEGIAADVWDKIYSNFVISVGGKASEFQKVLDENANRLSQLGEYTGDIPRLLSFELQQVNSNAISARSTVGAFGRGGVNPWDVSAITDAAGNVAIQTGDRRRTFTKATNGTYKASTDDYGVLTKQGDIYQIKEIDGTVQSFLANGKLDFIQDTNGNKVTLGYTANLLTGLSYSNGDKVTFKYNAQGQVNEVVDIYGQSTTYTYDATGEKLLSVSDVSGTVTYAYETVGAKANAIKSITYPDGTQWLFEYDDLGRVTQESLNGGEQTLKYSYDSTGGVTVTDANNKSTQVLLNDRGQVAQTTDALGRVSRFSYDDKGNLTQILAPDSSNAKFSYDSKGNLLASTDALGQSVQFAYDARFDQIKSVKDQKGNAINYSYDDKGNLGSIGYADGSKESFIYSDRGDVTVSSNRRGQQISYTYDSRGLLTKKEFADGTSAAFEYDVRGNLTKATDADSSVTYAYDTADRLTNVSYGGTRSLSFSYDAGGRRSQMVDQDGFATNYSYDSVGRLKQLTDKDAKNIISYSYNTLGQLSREDNGNGTYTTYTYDDAGQALSIVNYKPDNSINSRYDYTYNQLGQRTSMTTLEGKTSYGYDATGQLTSVALASGRNIEYKYDAAGNRITVKDSGATTNYSTNNLNQYTTVGGNAYTYDKDGNLTSKTIGGKTSSFSYDIENRLIGVTNADGTWQYQYDALGNRIGSTFNGQKTDYLLDPTGLGDVVGEYTGSQATRYSHGLGLASRNDGTDTSFFDTDAIGSVVGLSGIGGNYLNSYSYLPFGESLTKTETVTNSFEYVGQYGVTNEANGLDFMRARFYMPGEGRFVSADPIGINGGLNLYTYVGNTPLIAVDPSGLCSFSRIGGAQEILSKILSIAGGASTAAKGTLIAGGIGAIEVEYLLALPVAELLIIIGAGAAAFGAGYTAGLLAQDLGDCLEEHLFSDPPSFEPPNAQDTMPPPNDENETGKGKKSSPPASKGKKPPASTPPNGDKNKSDGNPPSDSGGDGIGEQLKEKSPPGKKEGQGSTTVPRSSDPNDIIGPGGTGPDRWLTPDPILPYTIRFENQATATAPAVLVNITHTLDSDLDLNTFELGDFGFGSTTITVPDGLQNYTTRLDLRDTIGDFVDFTATLDTATLDTATRLVTWKIVTIDPLTGEPAEGVKDGFLPPNNANGDGNGFVNYRIKAKGDTPNGASLDAQASIIFDTNAPIVTPVWTNKIDTAAPTSTITALPATINTTDFTVAWTGNDSGSGVVSYDIYVSDNSGEFQIWKSATTDLSATYSGTVGHTYAFYSIATDGVGRTQTIPTSAQASISIQQIADTLTLAAVASSTYTDTAALDTFNNITGTLVGTDSKPSATLTYGITGGTVTNSISTLAGTYGSLSVNTKTGAYTYTPDATKINALTTNTSDNFTFIVSDGTLTANQPLAINITGANDAPTLTAVTSGTYTDTAANDTFNNITGTIVGTDRDTGTTLTYGITGGTVTNSISILTGNYGTLSIDTKTGAYTYTPDAAKINALNTNTSDNFTFTVSDGTLTTNQPFAINITGANDTPNEPVLNPTQIAENVAIGSTIGKFTTTDPDTSDSFAYSLTTGTGSTNNDLFEIVGDELKLKISPDYETKSSYTVRVKVTDKLGLTNEQTFTISITDVNEPPTQLVINNSQIAENVPANTVVGTFNATTSKGDTLTYSLVTGEGSTDNQFFEIVDNTIRIKITPDFEIKPNYTVRVKATNQNGLSTEKPFPINITNTNEAPTQVTINSNQLAENSPIDTIVAQLTTTDPDADDSFTYSLAPNNLFTITGNQLKLIASPDYETKSSYQLQLTSTDKAGLSINQPLTINITDVAEPTILKNTNNQTFQLSGDQGSKNLSFQIASQNSTKFAETGLFKVDDNLGTINGIKPGDPGYLAAALDRFQIISSIIPIANLPQGFDGNTSRSLNLSNGDIIRFGVVSEGSIDQLRQTPTALDKLTLSEPATLQLTDTNGNLTLNWQNPLNLNINAKITNAPTILGNNTQKNTQGELIDLRQSTTDVTATFSIYREAAYNNIIYFYNIQNETGTILDGTTTLNPTDPGYIQAALRNAITNVNLSTPDQSSTTSTATLQKGSLLAPLIVVNSFFNSSNAYTPFILGNADKVDHIRLLGDNTFGFEDLAGGGDLDYNDVIVKISLK
jgi:RHS repeat-associated protein